MIILFTSEGCSTCKKTIRDIPSDWGDILVLDVKFDEEERCYRVYKDDIPLGDKAPIDAVPTLCMFETREVYSGYKDIIERLTDV